MEGVRTFLESSTIHGLTYISTTRKYARLFWTLVVITGFLVAGYLIHESFDSWSESPVKTTVETLPIADIRFPKVTVCPPKNTFTDLNYDLMMTENVTLRQEMRDEMFKYALEVINEDGFSRNNWTKLQEGDRFYNWYHGYTQIISPYYDDNSGLNILIYTSATSGVITTQNFGEQFKAELVERKLYYNVDIWAPDSDKQNKNVTLHVKVEKASMTALGRKKKDKFRIGWDYPDADQTIVFKNYTPPAPMSAQSVILTRDVSSEEVEAQKLDLMPGFRLTWWYTGAEVTPDNIYKYFGMNKHFVRLAKNNRHRRIL